MRKREDHQTLSLFQEIPEVIRDLVHIPLKSDDPSYRDVPRNRIKLTDIYGRSSYALKEQTELADTIRQKGIIEPVILRPIADINYDYELIAGYRRVNAADVVGLTEIPAVVRDMDDATALIVSIMENLQRQNPDPVDLAKQFQELGKRIDPPSSGTGTKLSVSGSRDRKRRGTWNVVEALTGKSKRTIHRYIKLNELPVDKLDSLRRLSLTEKHGRALLMLNKAKHLHLQDQLLQEIERTHWTGDQAVARAYDLLGRPSGPRGPRFRPDFRGVLYEPVNEQGVVFLFGMVAAELGFEVELVQAAFPDCEAKRRDLSAEEQWIPVKIELEFASINFQKHGHVSGQCDLIICWKHNWPDCPIEVLELKSAIKKLKNDV